MAPGGAAGFGRIGSPARDGFPDLPPTNAPGYLAHDCASVYGAIAAVAAVLDAERRGEPAGQLVDISVQEAALAGTNPWSIALHSYSKLNPLLSPEGKRSAEGAYWVLPAADGWVRAVIGSPRQWNGFVELMRSPEALLEDVWNSHSSGCRTPMSYACLPPGCSPTARGRSCSTRR